MDVGGSGLSCGPDGSLLGLREPLLQCEPARVAHQELSSVGHAGPVPQGVPRSGGLLVCVRKWSVGFIAWFSPICTNAFGQLVHGSRPPEIRAPLQVFRSCSGTQVFCRKRPAPHPTPKSPKSVAGGGSGEGTLETCPRARLLMAVSVSGPPAGSPQALPLLLWGSAFTPALEWKGSPAVFSRPRKRWGVRLCAR